MTSRKKPNGAASVDHVEQARKKAGLGVGQMFCLAQHVADELPPGFRANEEARKFIRYKDEGGAVHPHYQVPDCVLGLADQLHEAASPQQLCDELRARMHARAMHLARRANQHEHATAAA